MKRTFNRLILLAGFSTLAFLLWRYEPRKIWTDISAVGAGFLLIVPFQIFDHFLNALGWRFAFSPAHAGRVPLGRLIWARIGGDGVNYLTPSASIAGEFVRPGLLGPILPDEVKNASVLVAKFTQAIGQGVFILLGLLFVLKGRLNFLSPSQRLGSAAAAGLTMGVVIAAMVFLARKPSGKGWFSGEVATALRGQLRGYLKAHPGRFALSTLFFILGYCWGAAEVWLICRFMGVEMPFLTALAVETLSNVVDSVMFMVPAKVGTQEAGKAVIFAGLGYPAGTGLAFGLVRHARELIWAAAGLLICAFNRPKPGPPSPLPGSPRSEPAPPGPER